MRFLTYMVFCLASRGVTQHLLQKHVFLAKIRGIAFSYQFDDNLLEQKMIHSKVLAEDIEELIRNRVVEERVRVLDPVFETHQMLLEPSTSLSEARKHLASDPDFQQIDRYAGSVRGFDEARLINAIEGAMRDSSP